MKNFITLTIAILLSATTFAGNGDKKIEIKGTIENAEGKTLYINAFVNNKPVVIDSAILKKSGKFKLSVNASTPQFFSVNLSQKDYVLLVLDQNTSDEVQLNANSEKLLETYTVDGSKDSKLIQTFVKDLNSHQMSKQKLSREMYNKNTTNERKAAIKTELETSDSGFKSRRDEFIRKNAESIAVLTVMGYLDPKQDLELYKTIEQGLAKSVPNSEYHIAIQTQVKQIETQLKIQRQQEAEREKMMKLSAIGEVAPELNFKSPDGKVITLESLRGKYVLIDFWASWCRPCRMENPNVVKAYNKYKDLGFSVYSVSLDKDAGRWKAAIAQDGLIWPNHVSDLKQWQSEAVKIYGFRGIPHTILIDKEGKIMQKNLRGPALEEKLKEIFGE